MAKIHAASRVIPGRVFDAPRCPIPAPKPRLFRVCSLQRVRLFHSPVRHSHPGEPTESDATERERPDAEKDGVAPEAGIGPSHGLHCAEGARRGERHEKKDDAACGRAGAELHRCIATHQTSGEEPDSTGVSDRPPHSVQAPS